MQRSRHYRANDEPVPGYRLVRVLGSGGFGETWQATAPGGTQVAIKIISKDRRVLDKEFRALKLVKKVHYPNLVPILAIWLKNANGEILDEADFDKVGRDSTVDHPGQGISETINYAPRPEPAELIVAMGLGEMSLDGRLDECREKGLPGIPVDELLNYLQDAARAIDYLRNSRRPGINSDKALQHCDIKPQNILIVGDAAQVIDFSLAREVDDLRVTSLSSSPAYAAPEFIETNIASPTTDQYSLAVTYVELRTGELPFPPNATQGTVIQAHLSGNLDLSRLPPAERSVVRRATSRNPADRYPSAVEMVQALREAVQPKVAPGVSWRVVTAGVATFMVAVLAVSLAIVFANRPQLIRLPLGYVSAGEEAVTLGESIYPKRIFCERIPGLRIPLVLVDEKPGEPFYIMQDKVSNQLYAAFAAAEPQKAGDLWEFGAKAGDSQLSARSHLTLPVVNVTCDEAEAFATWLGGHLPTKEQWNAAAGLPARIPPRDFERQYGPYLAPWDPDDPHKDQVAVGRRAEGPLPVGTASRDRSKPYGCRDMAGNGREWTRSYEYGGLFDPSAPRRNEVIWIRGRSYEKSEPLQYWDFEDPDQRDMNHHYIPGSNLSFRVVVTIDDPAESTP